IINILHQLMKNLNEQIYELKESIINAFQRLIKNLNKEKQENEQIRNETLFLEQENKRIISDYLFLKQENQRIRNEMNNNINALQKQIYQMEYTRLQFKEVLQKERTRLRTNYQNGFNEYFQYYNDYFQNLTLQSTEEIRRLTAMIEKKTHN
ncbi:13454_t:CDS:1, partial [Dentiscutata erythropus]